MNLNHNMLLSAVQMCLSHIIIYHICLSSTGSLQTHKNDKLPVGLIAQLVERAPVSQRSRVRIPFKPEFFRAFFSFVK